MKAKKYYLSGLALALLIPAATHAASFDSMFGGPPVTSLDQWIQLTWAWLARFLILACTVMLMAAGYIYMAAGGDPQKVELARKIITGVFSGLLLLLISYFFLTQVLGLPATVWSFY